MKNCVGDSALAISCRPKSPAIQPTAESIFTRGKSTLALARWVSESEFPKARVGT